MSNNQKQQNNNGDGEEEGTDYPFKGELLTYDDYYEFLIKLVNIDDKKLDDIHSFYDEEANDFDYEAFAKYVKDDKFFNTLYLTSKVYANKVVKPYINYLKTTGTNLGVLSGYGRMKREYFLRYINDVYLADIKGGKVPKIEDYVEMSKNSTKTFNKSSNRASPLNRVGGRGTKGSRGKRSVTKVVKPQINFSKLNKEDIKFHVNRYDLKISDPIQLLLAIIEKTRDELESIDLGGGQSEDDEEYQDTIDEDDGVDEVVEEKQTIKIPTKQSELIIDDDGDSEDDLEAEED